MTIRLYLALLGVVLALAGHATGTPGVLLAGVAALVPLLVKVVRLPKAARGGFVLTAVVAGLMLAGLAAGHHNVPADQPRAVSAACVAGVAR